MSSAVPLLNFASIQLKLIELKENSIATSKQKKIVSIVILLIYYNYFNQEIIIIVIITARPVDSGRN